MGSEWRPFKIDHLISKRNQGVNTTTEKVSYSESGFKVIRANNISGDGLNWADCVYVDTPTFEKIKEPCKPKRGDILYTNIGSQFGVAVKVESDEEFVIAWNVLRIQTSDVVDTDFLVYVLNNPKNRSYIQSLNASSTMPFVSGKVIGELEFDFPSVNTQIEIKKILRSLDNKITLNRQLNQTLEQMAQALFKSWFVDFDPVIDNALAAGNVIPDDLQDRAERRQLQLAKADHKPLPENIRKLFPSEFELTESLGWVPKGWGVSSTDQIAKTNPISWTAKNAPDFVEYVDLSNAKNGVIEDTICYEFGEAPSRARRVLEPHDTIFGLVRPGNRSFAYVHNQGLTGSTGFAVMRPKSENLRAFLYFHLTRDDVVDEFARIADGAAYPAIRPEEVTSLETVIPSDEILNQYQNIAGNALNKIGQNYFQNKELSQLRDTLLPKLISGELRIPEAESALTLALSQRERGLESANE